MITGRKPDDGITQGQPFTEGIGTCKCFRIPSLITMEDGTLVAAADARWNHTGDGFGLDTIVSRSKDSGETWEYTFANYMGDNGNCYHPKSTAFIDPAMTVKDGIIYLLVDLYPGGVYIINAEPGTGFDETGFLMLKKGNDETYEYRLRSDDSGRLGIFKKDGTQVLEITVDAYFNWYDETQPERPMSNLFYAESEWKVVPTCYLYLTKSVDGGKTWSAPFLLNYQVKQQEESFYGVGPGRGLTLKSGRILFPCYVFNGVDNQRASFIYSDDDGRTWKRSAHVTDEIYSGESQLVELKNGAIRCFFRNNQSQLCYADAVWKDREYCWGAVIKSGVESCPDCQLSAIAGSNEIDGKQLVYVSCPADTKQRQHGILLCGLVDENGETKWNIVKEITGKEESFAYSCLTELPDGTLAILYENEWSRILFRRL